MTHGEARSEQHTVEPEDPGNAATTDPAENPGRAWVSGRRWWVVASVAVPLAVCTLVLAVCGPPAVLTDLLAKRTGAPPAAQAPQPLRAFDILIEQSHALLAGDEAGWLKHVSGEDPALRRRYHDLFINLRGLGVTRFDPTATGGGPGPVQVSIEYCVASGHCCPTTDACRARLPVQPFEVPKTRWTVTFADRGGALRITGLHTPPPDPKEHWPVPWETGPLTIKSDSRVIVAAPPALADLVAATFAQAQAAAPTIDGYAKVWRPPLRYIIYLADAESFNKVWYGGTASWDEEVAGYAVSQVRHVQYEIVLGVPFAVELPQLVRHEMAHVVTLDTADTARGLGTTSHPWLTEGIAEYAAYQGLPATANPKVRAAKSYIAKQWAGDLTQPATSKDPKAAIPAHIKYAVGHLAVACLVQEYSFTSMLTLFNLLVRDDRDLDTAARASFGSTWQTVNDHCANYIRGLIA